MNNSSLLQGGYQGWENVSWNVSFTFLRSQHFETKDKHIEFLLLHTLSSLLIFSFPILRDVINPPSPKKIIDTR